MQDKPRLKHYEKLANRWFAVGIDWQALECIYVPDIELHLERLARLIGGCYDGMADGRRSRYAILDVLKREYAWYLEHYEGVVDDMRRLGEICPTCHYAATPPWELPEGERPCACD